MWCEIGIRGAVPPTRPGEDAMNKWLIGGFTAIAALALSASVSLAACLQKPTVKACMACIQAKGDAGPSGGRNFCKAGLRPPAKKTVRKGNKKS